MTLILSLATKNYIVQVSDRRLTIGNGPFQGRLVDDDSNKVTLFCNRMSFAYTGLASINGKRTDYWLVDILSKISSNSLSDACNMIVNSATSEFAKIRNNKIKKQAFVGVGWTRSGLDEPIKPIICNISNALNDQLNWLPEAEDKFVLRYSVLNGNDCYLFSQTGLHLPHRIIRPLTQNINKLVKKEIGPYSLGRLLAEAVWNAAKNNETIGSNLLLVSMPRAALESNSGIVIASMPDEKVNSFMYLNPSRNDGIVFGPNYVCNGSGITNFQSGPIR